MPKAKTKKTAKKPVKNPAKNPAKKKRRKKRAAPSAPRAPTNGPIPGDPFKVVVLPGSKEAAIIVPLAKLAEMLRAVVA